MLNWYPLSFDSDGNALDPNQVDGSDGIATALFGLPDQPVSDLWVLSYGWNTSIDDGDVFYDTWVNYAACSNAAGESPRLSSNVYWCLLAL